MLSVSEALNQRTTDSRSISVGRDDDLEPDFVNLA